MSGCYAVFHKQLGDLLLLEPALSRLQAHHGGSVSVLTRSGHAPLLQLMEGVQWQKGTPLRPHRHLYCFDPLNKSALRSLFAPVARRHCLLPDAHESAWFHRFLFGDVVVPGLGNRYVAEYFWSLLPVSANGAFRPPRLTPPPDSWRPQNLGDEPFLLLNPTSGWRQKNWQPDRWAEVIKALAALGTPGCLITSASADWQVAHCRAIENLAGPLIHNLGTATTLENFLWLTANARLVLTVDGAASHLAAAFGVPNLTLFGPTHRANWHYPTSTSHALQAATDRDGKARLRNLPTAEVIRAAEKLWSHRDDRRNQSAV